MTAWNDAICSNLSINPAPTFSRRGHAAKTCLIDHAELIDRTFWMDDWLQGLMPGAEVSMFGGEVGPGGAGCEAIFVL